MISTPYITIFTSTYNRADTLPILFDSLINQDNTDFEWLIVNDGSIDNTVDLVGAFIKKSPFSIRLINTKNGGKHRAINKGMKQAKGIWFATVDSDDFLLPDAVSQIIQFSKETQNKNTAALCFLKQYKGGKIVGDAFSGADEVDSFLNYFDSGIKGDKFQIFKTSILNEFPFPEFYRENFIAESALYLPFGSKYYTRFINKGFYICEYLDGGLSDNSVINRIKCPNGALYIYKLRFELSNRFFIKFNGAINWWRFYFHGKINSQNIVVDKPDGWAKWCFIGGFFVMALDLLKLKKKPD